MEQIAVETPAEDQIAVEHGTLEESAVEQIAEEASTVEPISLEAPANGQITTEVSAVEQDTAEAPVVEQIAVEAPAVEQIAVEAPSVETIAVEAPSVEQIAVEAPAVELATTDLPAVELSTTQLPAVELSTTQLPAVEKATTETSAVEQATGTLVAEQAIAEAPIVQETAATLPAEPLTANHVEMVDSSVEAQAIAPKQLEANSADPIAEGAVGMLRMVTDLVENAVDSAAAEAATTLTQTATPEEAAESPPEEQLSAVASLDVADVKETEPSAEQSAVENISLELVAEQAKLTSSEQAAAIVPQMTQQQLGPSTSGEATQQATVSDVAGNATGEVVITKHFPEQPAPAIDESPGAAAMESKVDTVEAACLDAPVITSSESAQLRSPAVGQDQPQLLDPVVPRRTKTPSGSSGKDDNSSRNRDSYQLTKEEIEESLSFIKSKLSSTPLPPVKTKRPSGSVVGGSEAGRSSVAEAPDYEPVQPLGQLTPQPPRQQAQEETVPVPVPLPVPVPVPVVPLPVLVADRQRDATTAAAEANGAAQNQFARECIPPVRPMRMKKGGTLQVPEWRPPKENVFAYFFGCFGMKNK